MIDRRADVRVPPHRPEATRATLRPGCEVRLVDVSASGALVQAARPLRPGARVLLQLAIDDRNVSLSAHVLRCAVWALDALAGATYRGALKFEHRCEWMGEPRTQPGSLLPSQGTSDPATTGHRLPEVDRQPSESLRRCAK